MPFGQLTFYMVEPCRRFGVLFPCDFLPEAREQGGFLFLTSLSLRSLLLIEERPLCETPHPLSLEAPRHPFVLFRERFTHQTLSPPLVFLGPSRCATPLKPSLRNLLMLHLVAPFSLSSGRSYRCSLGSGEGCLLYQSTSSTVSCQP